MAVVMSLKSVANLYNMLHMFGIWGLYVSTNLVISGQGIFHIMINSAKNAYIQSLDIQQPLLIIVLRVDNVIKYL